MPACVVLPSAAGADAATEADRSRALLREGRFADAETAARQVLATAIRNPGNDSSAYARAADLIVPPLVRNGGAKRAETRDLAWAAVRIKERALPADSAGLAESLRNLGEMLLNAGDSPAARGALRRALAIQLSADDTLAAAALTLLGRAVTDSNRTEAHRLLRMALAIREKRLPAEHPDVARSLYFVGWIQRLRGNWEESREYLERALAMQERVLQPDHPELASTLQQYGWLLSLLGERPRAITVDQRALAIRERALAPRHPDVGHALNDLGFLHMANGSYREAGECLSRALAIFEDFMGVDAAQPATTRANLARLALAKGDYPEARRLFERALNSMEKARGPDHPDVAAILGSYGELLAFTGDVRGAVVRLERAVAIFEQDPVAQRARWRAVSFSLAAVLADLRDFDRADSIYTRILGPIASAGDTVMPNLVAALGDWSGQNFQRGRYLAAQTLARKALAIAEEDSADGEVLGYAASRLGMVEAALGHPAEADRLLDRAVRVTLSVCGPDHPSVAYGLSTHAEALLGMGRTDDALAMALEAERIGREHVTLTMETLSERQALAYAAVRPSGLNVALTLAEQGLAPRDRADVFDAVMRARSVVLDGVASRHRQVANLSRSAQAMTAASERLAYLTVRGPAGEDPNVYRKMIEEARRARERAEQELGESSSSFRALRSERAQGLRDVAAAIPERSALVSFVAYSRCSRSARVPDESESLPPESLFVHTPAYLAFVLRAGARDPEVVPLGSRSVVDGLVARWSEEVARGSKLPSKWVKESAYRPAGEALRRVAWDPIVPHLAGVERVFIVPDGALQLVSFATLPTRDSTYLIETGPTAHTLGAERDLVRHGESAPAGEGLLALGGPSFDRTPVAVRDASKASIAAAGPFRGALPECAEFSTLRWEALPGARREVLEIESLWKKDMSPARVVAAATTGPREVEALIGPEATEANFKRLAPGRRVLHVATHGFFLDARCGSGPAPEHGVASSGQPRTQPAAGIENPLLLTGFALAGANARATAPANADDGILTGEEIAALDLTGVEWAVLSACETGVGEVRAGEGVFGLRRAFQIAGARTLIMSLWSVEDEAARRWMEALYRARLERQLPTADAVREASLEVLRARRAKGESVHPFYWGAFVAAGDWR